jgi:hypothetical protein
MPAHADPPGTGKYDSDKRGIGMDAGGGLGTKAGADASSRGAVPAPFALPGIAGGPTFGARAGLALLTAGVFLTGCGAAARPTVSVTHVGTGAGSTTTVAAVTVAGIPASSFEARGIYLGRPGITPKNAPTGTEPAPPTTHVGTSSSQPPGTDAPSPEQLAVQGDPANGMATVSAAMAVHTALTQGGGFTGYVTTGTPVLVQFDEPGIPVLATAWAIPMTGTVMLSAGAVPEDGGTVATRPPVTETAVAFIDAVTGKFISEEGFGH